MCQINKRQNMCHINKMQNMCHINKMQKDLIHNAEIVESAYDKICIEGMIKDKMQKFSDKIQKLILLKS